MIQVAGFRGHFDHDSAMIARAPLFRFIGRVRPHVPVNPPRCNYVVEMVCCRARLLACGMVRRNVLRVRRKASRRRRSHPSVRMSRSHDLEPERLQACEHASVPLRECQVILFGRPVDEVEVAGDKDPVCGRVLVADECAQIRNGMVGHGVGIADAPGGGRGRMRFLPPGVERDCNEGQAVFRDDPGSGNGICPGRPPINSFRVKAWNRPGSHVITRNRSSGGDIQQYHGISCHGFDLCIGLTAAGILEPVPHVVAVKEDSDQGSTQRKIGQLSIFLR